MIAAVLTVALDRASKWMVARTGAPGNLIAGCPVLRRVENRSGNGRPGGLVLLWVFAAGILLAAAASGAYFRSEIARIAISSALAGAASNVYDRITRRAVLDFIDLGWWPAFNLADVAITCGVITALMI